MNIKGVMEVEGVRLFIAIDAPDESRDIYVTNVHPNCVVIPKERWPVEYLGLSQYALRDLAEHNVTHLDQLVDGQWQLSRKGLNKNTDDEIIASLDGLRRIALLFEQLTPGEIARELVGYPVRSSSVSDIFIADDQDEVDRASVSPDTPLQEIEELPAKLRDILHAAHGVSTIADVLKLGLTRVIMTPNVDANDVNLMKIAFEHIGHPLTLKKER